MPRYQPGGRSSLTAAPRRRPEPRGDPGAARPLAGYRMWPSSPPPSRYGRPAAGCAYPPVQAPATPVV